MPMNAKREIHPIRRKGLLVAGLFMNPHHLAELHGIAQVVLGFALERPVSGASSSAVSLQ